MADKFVTWVKKESKRLQAEEGDFPGPKIGMELEAITHWKANRPQMMKRLEAAGAVEAAAHVLVDRAVTEADQLIEQGMPYPDAMERGMADWMMMGPEDEQPEVAAPIST